VAVCRIFVADAALMPAYADVGRNEELKATLLRQIWLRSMRVAAGFALLTLP